jgi:hypothetical protein
MAFSWEVVGRLPAQAYRVHDIHGIAARRAA